MYKVIINEREFSLNASELKAARAKGQKVVFVL